MITTQYFVRTRPHQSLESLAAYHLEVIEKKVAAGTTDGITHDCTSLLIALAFDVEALMNLVGLGLLRTNWNERDRYYTKLNKIAKRLEFTVDRGVEPYLTLKLLKEVRDQLAHAKPFDGVLPFSSDQRAFSAVSPNWYKHCTPKFANESFNNVCEFRRMLFERAKLKTGFLLSSVSNLD